MIRNEKDHYFEDNQKKRIEGDYHDIEYISIIVSSPINVQVNNKNDHTTFLITTNVII